MLLFDVVYDRIQKDTKNQRPVFLNHSKEDFKVIYDGRIGTLIMNLADLVVTVDNRTPEEVARFIKCMVGYLGPSGSFTHNAALKAFPEAELVSLGTITEVIKSYEEGRVDYAVIPVENSIEGSVHESLDYLFHQADIRAVAEIVQPINSS